MGHELTLALLWGAGTLVVLCLLKFIFTLIPNPFDELDEEDIKEMEEAGKSLADISDKIKDF